MTLKLNDTLSTIVKFHVCRPKFTFFVLELLLRGAAQVWETHTKLSALYQPPSKSSLMVLVLDLQLIEYNQDMQQLEHRACRVIVRAMVE